MGTFCFAVLLARPHKMYKQVLLMFALAMATACATKYGHGYNDYSYSLGYNDHDSFSNYDRYNYNGHDHHARNSHLHKRSPVNVLYLPFATPAFLKSVKPSFLAVGKYFKPIGR